MDGENERWMGRVRDEGGIKREPENEMKELGNDDGTHGYGDDGCADAFSSTHHHEHDDGCIHRHHESTMTRFHRLHHPIPQSRIHDLTHIISTTDPRSNDLHPIPRHHGFMRQRPSASPHPPPHDPPPHLESVSPMNLRPHPAPHFIHPASSPHTTRFTDD